MNVYNFLFSLLSFLWLRWKLFFIFLDDWSPIQYHKNMIYIQCIIYCVMGGEERTTTTKFSIELQKNPTVCVFALCMYAGIFIAFELENDLKIYFSLKIFVFSFMENFLFSLHEYFWRSSIGFEIILSPLFGQSRNELKVSIENMYVFIWHRLIPECEFEFIYFFSILLSRCSYMPFIVGFDHSILNGLILYIMINVHDGRLISIKLASDGHNRLILGETLFSVIK